MVDFTEIVSYELKRESGNVTSLNRIYIGLCEIRHRSPFFTPTLNMSKKQKKKKKFPINSKLPYYRNWYKYLTCGKIYNKNITK